MIFYLDEDLKIKHCGFYTFTQIEKMERFEKTNYSVKDNAFLDKNGEEVTMEDDAFEEILQYIQKICKKDNVNLYIKKSLLND